MSLRCGKQLIMRRQMWAARCLLPLPHLVRGSPELLEDVLTGFEVKPLSHFRNNRRPVAAANSLCGITGAAEVLKKKKILSVELGGGFLGRRDHFFPSSSYPGIIHFSTSTTTSPPTARIAAEPVQLVPVQVGSSLNVDVSGTSAGVNVIVGDSLEEVLVQSNWVRNNGDAPPPSAGGGAGHGEKLDIASFDGEVSVRLSGGALRTELVEINSKIPARWCSVDIRGGSGSAKVESVREGNLSVRTEGGSVKVGGMKGSEACIVSGGGDVDVSEMQAKLEVRTGGGRLGMKKVQGTKIVLDSDGGDIRLGSVYGTEVTIESRGGSVEAGDLQGQERAFVSSRGGTVVINGIDGRAVVETQGGTVELQLNEYAEEVTVDAGENGKVVLCLSSRLEARLRYEGSEGVVQEGSILTSGSGLGMFEFAGRESASSRQMVMPYEAGWRNAEPQVGSFGGGPKPCNIHVISAGEVQVKERSWSELVMGKIFSGLRER